MRWPEQYDMFSYIVLVMAGAISGGKRQIGWRIQPSFFLCVDTISPNMPQAID